MSDHVAADMQPNDALGEVQALVDLILVEAPGVVIRGEVVVEDVRVVSVRDARWRPGAAAIA